jgi:hypothetical protein
MKKYFFYYALLLTFLFSFTACLRPNRSFERGRIYPPPDYSQNKYWAALPTVKDSADAVPKGAVLADGQSEAKADVFFIYPTIYLFGKTWNADVNKKQLNDRIDKSTILHQATVFNGSCRVYAPRYRQAVLKSFFKLNGNGKKALDFAYVDVKAAFEYYLKNYNNGRPVVIASHSQGTWHAQQLLHEYFEKDSSLRKRLIAAYLIGGWVKKNEYTNIPASNSASQTGCVISWNSFKWGVKNNKFFGTDHECVNPLTWNTDTLQASASLNRGSVPYGLSRIDKDIADAKISAEGLLWVHKKKMKGYKNGRNYHITDYNLFWMNIRENVKLRIDTYFEKNK